MILSSFNDVMSGLHINKAYLIRMVRNAVDLEGQPETRSRHSSCFYPCPLSQSSSLNLPGVDIILFNLFHREMFDFLRWQTLNHKFEMLG